MTSKVDIIKECDYDPFDHRQVEKPNSNLWSTINLVKASLGTGILAVPLAFSNSGWLVGLIGTVFVGFLCAHCIDIFVRISRDCCKIEQRPSLTYAETCRAALANGPKRLRCLAHTFQITADASLLLTYLGTCCIYVVLIANSLQLISKNFYPNNEVSIRTFCLMTILPLLALIQIKYLKWLAFVSIAANCMLFATFFICIYYIFGTGVITFEGREAVGDPYRYPSFFSTLLCAIEGIGVVMPVENNMSSPRNFLGLKGVLSSAMSIVVFLYASLGLCGYLRFGDDVFGSITLNLPKDDLPAVFANIFICISILLTFPLQYYVVMETYKNHCHSRVKESYKRTVELAVRILGLFLCVALAMALPMLEQIITIVGAVFFSTLGLTVPSLIDIIFRWNDLGAYNWRLWKNSLIIIFGIGCLVSGVTLAVNDIIVQLN